VDDVTKQRLARIDKRIEAIEDRIRTSAAGVTVILDAIEAFRRDTLSLVDRLDSKLVRMERKLDQLAGPRSSRKGPRK
jgi:hypothetical protein